MEEPEKVQPKIPIWYLSNVPTATDRPGWAGPGFYFWDSGIRRLRGPYTSEADAKCQLQRLQQIVQLEPL